ncbi:DUF5110 domain-containing protein [bacterium]|nr:DUF5110 domain-containing protein [bacterium]
MTLTIKHLILAVLLPIICQGQVLRGLNRQADQLDVCLRDGTLRIRPLTENSARIQYCRNDDFQEPELIFTSKRPAPPFRVSDSPSRVEMKTKNMIVVLDKETGTLSFADQSGKIFLSERMDSRRLIPDSVMGEPCFAAEQSFESPRNEVLFGLGQFQDGHHHLNNITRRLTQVNSQISLPFIYSSAGYGLLWHQYGMTDFNPADNVVLLEKQEQSIHKDNRDMEVTTTSGTQKVSQNQSLFQGNFAVPSDGVYSLFLDLGDMDNRHYVVIDGKPCMDISNFWLPPTACALVNLRAGDHQVQLVCKSANTPKLSWRLSGDEITFRSPHAGRIDYVVFYGPSADTVIAAYRNLSGNVPMLPRWAYGFWQCRERYTSGAQLVETVKEFRNRNLPMDVIVQDWQYWGGNGWGVPKFDDANYSNPAGFIQEIHDLNAHFNISIWSNPDRNSATGKEYISKNLYFPDSPWLDYFNPLTRETYWNTLNENLFSKGVDSWWMDATEPENDALKKERTHLGPGVFFRLTYPLMVSRAVYEGQRQTTSGKRVCILTRSAFLGQQRTGAINWSGDIGGNWDAYRRQIVAGLNYTITGLPFWTTDIGGFFRSGNSQYADENYQELLTRWFQWGAFNPVFRIHGYQSETEPWKYGQQVEENMRKMLNLRYRLLPSIYSEAWQVTKNGSTLMRPLVMDFREDTAALNRPFEYMFGKALLVAPVTEPDVQDWAVYLPQSPSWYDFWTGERFASGQTIKTPSPLNQIPLFVKAGSIVCMGPFIQYSTERIDPVEIRIYPGADGSFTLYEDENDNYNYETGMYSTISLIWEDSIKALTINDRQGAFPGMLKERQFNIVRAAPGTAAGTDAAGKYEKAITYKGKKIVVML